jgi:ribonuclease Z
MTWLVQARLINEPFADPGLFIDFRFRRRALLFDLGDLSPLSPRELLRVSHVFVSHAHMDHFAGFDTLLRVCLHRAEPLYLTGPPDFADRVAAKLAAYTWNLLDENSLDFAILVDEFDGRIGRSSRFSARAAFVREDVEPRQLAPDLVLEEDELVVEAAVLDHGIPCLAFALQERRRVNVWRDGLARMGLPVGPWLNEAKRAVRRGDPDDRVVAVEQGKTVTLGELRKEALQVAPGQRLAYVVDAAAHEANIDRAARLARGADHLFIEAAFSDEDAARADQRRHLTAGAAGRIAKQAGARQVIPFHFSPRYIDRPDLIAEQVNRAFADK